MTKVGKIEPNRILKTDPITEAVGEVFKEVVVDASLKIEKEYVNEETIKKGLALNAGIDVKLIEGFNDDCKIVKMHWCENGFITAARIAHSHHVPLCLSPDHVWTLIVQGFCNHMSLKHEQLRSQFVNFDGKK